MDNITANSIQTQEKQFTAEISDYVAKFQNINSSLKEHLFQANETREPVFA